MAKLTVKNDGKELSEALGLDPGSLRHVGNFVFEGKQGNSHVRIYTRPTDEEQEHIEFDMQRDVILTIDQ